jgi:hypothetical protein
VLTSVMQDMLDDVVGTGGDPWYPSSAPSSSVAGAGRKVKSAGAVLIADEQAEAVERRRSAWPTR